ncbi:MAG: FlgD immunoglobulin-like domain containing protein [Candidatus Krumholzibacteriota bacterium]
MPVLRFLSFRNRRAGPAALVSLLAFLVFCGPASGAEVRYVSSILDGPSAPTSLSVDGQGIGVLEPYSSQVQVFTADGILDGKVDINGDARGLALLRDRVYLFCDDEAATVAAIDLDSGGQTVFLDNLDQPVDVLVSGGECFVLDGIRRTVVVCNEYGSVTETVNLPHPVGEEQGWLADLAWDPFREIFYVFDQTHSRVLAYGRDGGFQGGFCGFGTHDGEVSRGGEIVCDAEGWIYVTDRYQGRVVVFDAEWSFVVNVDPIDLGRDRLLTPTGIAVDGAGFLYVAATEGSAIHIFHVDKSTTAAGQYLTRAVSPGAGDDMPVDNLQFVAGIQAPLAQASQVAVDFRLFDMADLLDPVAEAFDIPLVGGTALGDIVIGSVSWRPDVVLTEGRSYGWQARTKAGSNQGEWMALWNFVPTAAPLPFRLEQNTPNPFNPRTVIVFSLKDDSRANLTIYDVRGSQVWSADLSGYGPGTHQLVWEGQDNNGTTLPSGVYFYRLVSGVSAATRKMVLMR